MDNRIIRFFAGELESSEQRSLLREASSNSKKWNEMIVAQNIKSLMALHGDSKDEEAGRQAYVRFSRMVTIRGRKKRLFSLLRQAAVLMLFVIPTWWFAGRHKPSEHFIAREQVLYVPRGQRASLTLPDGSQVWVNAGSTLSFTSIFTGERRVRLQGEAYFKVAKGKIPFVVSAGKIDVVAHGTEFNVSNYRDGKLSVSLLEGAVRVFNPHDEKSGVMLTPSQMLVEEQGKFITKHFDENPVAWKNGILIFRKQKLGLIIEKLELYYGVDIQVEKRSLLENEYTGKFRQRDGVMEVLQIIRKIHPFRIRQEENTETITLS